MVLNSIRVRDMCKQNGVPLFSNSSDDKNEATNVELSGHQYQPETQGPLAVQVHGSSDRADENEDPWDLEFQRRQASEDVGCCRCGKCRIDLLVKRQEYVCYQ